MFKISQSKNSVYFSSLEPLHLDFNWILTLGDCCKHFNYKTFPLVHIVYMVEYDEITYLMNIVSLFLVTYGASCEFSDALHAIKCMPMVNKYMWQ